MPSKNVCSHCGEALCPCNFGVPHHYGHSEPGSEPERADDACTRAKLVTVKGCQDCPWRYRHTTTLKWVCAWGSDWLVIEDGTTPLKTCPFFTDGKPGPGVKIVAIKEDRG